MKKIGSVSEFGPARDEELWRAYRSAIANSGVVTMDELYSMAAASPSSRFWVSERRASEVMGMILRGISLCFMTPMRQEMFREIFNRFIAYRRKHPDSSIYEATFHAVNSPAPKFYLTSKSAKVIICRFRRNKMKK